MEQREYKKPYTGGPIPGWAKGMDNRRANFDVSVDSLRSAINCDILASGKVRMRRGITQKIAEPNAHSLFADDYRMIWGTSNTLRMCLEALSPSTLLTDARLAYPFSAVAVNGEIYFSSEYINGKVNSSGVYEPWGITPPSVAPACTNLDSGSLNREYQVTCTFVAASGEESGAPLGTKVMCGDTGNIQLTNIPQSSDSRVRYTRIYVTDIDDTEFYQCADVPIGVTSLAISGAYGTGKQLRTQFLVAPPLGQLLEYTRGRLYIAAGNILWFTEPLRYGCVHPVHGFYMFPERITMVTSVNDGIYVSSDITYFIDGDPSPNGKPSLNPVLPYKSIEGAICHLADSPDVLWLSERGIVLGSNGGKVQNLTEENIAMDSAARACMGIVETDGLKSAVAVMKQSTDSSFLAKDYIASEQDRIADLRG